MHTQRRYATCPQGMSKEEEKDSPYSGKKREKKGERGIMQMSSSTIHQTKKIYIHIPAHLDQGL